MSRRDREAQRLIGSATRRVNRRRFMQRAAQGTAGALAAVIVGGGVRPDKAFAHGQCYPPCGKYCSTCTASGGCGSGKTTCTKYDQSGSLRSCCIYASGYWYTGAYPYRHICRDCKTTYGPWSCSANCAGICGCKSTNHY